MQPVEGSGMDFFLKSAGTVLIRMAEAEPEAVKIAADNLEKDLKKVLRAVQVIRRSEKKDSVNADWSVIRIGTVGISDEIGELADTERMKENGQLHREAYQIRVRDGQLIIAGSDRRGTVYGIYSLCEWMGVSPWYFWADVPVYFKDELRLPQGYCVTDWPSVEYRGIFINDEEELEAWVQNYMKEPTIGVKTYERIFELLLRLKANYIWPAMHVNSFNLKRENGALAERMGIVVGTSHCDMLMRSNNREWIPWITQKGYTDAVYDYSIEGRNRDILKEYWRESVEQNRDFEVCYTLGMRGIHDSGFETKNLEGKSPEEIRDAKAALLEKIITDQREILKNALGHETMSTFIPYKEVLELYDNGLEIPEDVTLVWANDNYGYIRRYPSEKEKRRKGGNGIYYHNSYWAPPSMSYVFLCSIPLAHTRHELQKAWNEGIRKLWVLNCGAMKPLEQEITFFLRLAWEIGKEGALTEDVEAFAADWIDKTFTGGIGWEVSGLLNDFSQLTNVRKLENMDYDAFSQTAYGDEAAVRIHQYEELFDRGNALYAGLPDAEKAAFFQLVLMRIHAGYFTNLAYYYADRSTLMFERKNMQAAALYTKKSRQFEDARRRMVLYYNTVMSEGKWNGIVNPEGFPPPRAAMMPACTPPVTIAGAPHMRVDLWNEANELELWDDDEKWLEIGVNGSGELLVEMRAPEWIRISAADPGTEPERAEFSEHSLRAKVGTELRVCVCIDKKAAAGKSRASAQEAPGRGQREGLRENDLHNRFEERSEIVIQSVTEGYERRIPVCVVTAREAAECETGMKALKGAGERGGAGRRTDVDCTGCSAYAREKDGLVALEGDSADGLGEADSEFCMIPRLGRCRGNLVEARPAGADELPSGFAKKALGERRPLVYSFVSVSRGQYLLEIHRFPSLNSVGRIRIGVSLDGGPVQIAESFSNDEWRGSWKKNVLNNVDRLYVELGTVSGGMHRLRLYAVDSYFAFSRLVIYTKPRKENNLAGINGAQGLPRLWDERQWCSGFYGGIELKPRAVEYRTAASGDDSLAKSGCSVTQERYAKGVAPEWYLKRGSRIFEEQKGSLRIDAASALAQSGFAWTAGGLWRHCAGESFGRSGLCLYVRKPGLRWKKAADAPSLHYRFHCEGGEYTVWMLTKFNDAAESWYALGMDGAELEKEKLYQKGQLFRYESEQIYQWVPAAKLRLEAGEHVLDVYSMASGMRFDRFYLTRGEELPPLDSEWSSVR